MYSCKLFDKDLYCKIIYINMNCHHFGRTTILLFSHQEPSRNGSSKDKIEATVPNLYWGRRVEIMVDSDWSNLDYDNNYV